MSLTPTRRARRPPSVSEGSKTEAGQEREVSNHSRSAGGHRQDVVLVKVLFLSPCTVRLLQSDVWPTVGIPSFFSRSVPPRVSQLCRTVCVSYSYSRSVLLFSPRSSSPFFWKVGKKNVGLHVEVKSHLGRCLLPSTLVQGRIRRLSYFLGGLRKLRPTYKLV